MRVVRSVHLRRFSKLPFFYAKPGTATIGKDMMLKFS